MTGSVGFAGRIMFGVGVVMLFFVCSTVDTMPLVPGLEVELFEAELLELSAVVLPVLEGLEQSGQRRFVDFTQTNWIDITQEEQTQRIICDIALAAILIFDVELRQCVAMDVYCESM